MEEMPSEAHIDPGVTAAVEACKQHGDDEGHGCKRGDREKLLLFDGIRKTN